MTDNKFSKYLLYSISEITLIIVGVLIALAINSSYEKKIKEDLTRTILSQVYTDLETNIESAGKIHKYYQRKDSLSLLVIENKVTVGDHKKEKTPFNSLVLKYETFTVKYDGFTALVESGKDIPPDLIPIYNSLKELYKVKAPVIELINKQISDAVAQHHNELIETTDWYSDLVYYSKAEDEAINYFLDDLNYKNRVSRFVILGIASHNDAIMDFRYTAFQVYKELGKLLEMNQYAVGDSISFKSDIDQYSYIEGRYGNTEMSLEILIENEKIWFDFEYGPRYNVVPISKTSFQIENLGMFTNFTLAKDGVPVSLKFGYEKQHTVLRRVSD